MEYTIETIVRVKGGEGSGVSIFKKQKQGDNLQAVVAAQVRSLCNYYEVPHEALRGIEAPGALLGKTKHPLEEVFAMVEITGPVFDFSCGFIDRAFRDYAERGQETTNQEARLRRAVWWAAARLIKQGRYQTIEDVLAAAVLQATKGKGQRHGGDNTPFLEQPWAKLYRTHGLGFLLGQADKKYHEALGKPDTESFEREILGAIVYLGMALLALEGRV